MNFQTNAQVSKVAKRIKEFFSVPSNKVLIIKESKDIPLNSIKPNEVKEPYQVPGSYREAIADKSTIRLSEIKRSKYGRDLYGHEKDFPKDDTVIFASPTEKENFMYLIDKDIIDVDATDFNKEFIAVTSILKKKYGVTQFNVKNQKFINAVNDVMARNVLANCKFIDLKQKNGNISFAVMVFQKYCKLPVTGKLDGKTINACNMLTYKGIKKKAVEEVVSSGSARVDFDYSYSGNSVIRKDVDMFLQSKYLKPERMFSLTIDKTDSKWKIPYLKYIAGEKLISSDKELWTNIAVEKGFFRYQKNKGLQLTGELDNATLTALKRDIVERDDKIFAINSDETFLYKNKTYQKFTEVPFQSSDHLSFGRTLSSEEAGYLMKRGVKFVYNNKAYLRQRDKSFKIIYLISEDPATVQKLYDLDEANAKKLISFSAGLFRHKSITTVSSFDEMIAKQNEIIKNHEVPILIFHNNVDKIKLALFDPECNFITCNSFTVNPDAYLISTDYLDMQAIVQGITSSCQNKTLYGFYSDFTSCYFSYMKQKHQQTTLLYLGSAATIGGASYAIVYYNQKK
ncbi:hypothetical protein BOW57_09735 [Flavobacterium sp. YO64]|nr:hypothetical protein BOW57_09735 [Flavobacterium sp. YO64]